MTVLRLVNKFLDGVVALLGGISALLALYCMFFGVADVFFRYALNSPSLWIGETMKVALVLFACTAGAYAYEQGDFIKLDLFYARLSARRKALWDICTVFLTVLFLIVLIWKGIQAAQFSIKLKQVTPTAIPIPIYPLKSLIPVAGFIMLLLVIRQFLRDICVLRGKEQPQPAVSE